MEAAVLGRDGGAPKRTRGFIEIVIPANAGIHLLSKATDFAGKPVQGMLEVMFNSRIVDDGV